LSVCPRHAGLALTIALVADAILDPIVGYWSDNFRSKWGRCNPFMYASAIPVAVSFFLLWTPPRVELGRAVLVSAGDGAGVRDDARLLRDAECSTRAGADARL